MNDIKAMALNFYGFGRWSSPHWFIGLEQGGADNIRRAKAFKGLQSDGLCDCRQFHHEIGELRWHKEEPEPQKTWGRLRRLMALFHGIDTDKSGLLSYQKNHWGSRSGDTCVIELRGLAAAGLGVKVDRRKEYEAKRIATIRKKLAENDPTTMVLYGFSGEASFQVLTSGKLLRGHAVEHDQQVMIFVDHPARQRKGNTDLSWNDLGTSMRATSTTYCYDRLLVERLAQGFRGSLPANKAT